MDYFSCCVTPKPNTHLGEPSLVGLTRRSESNGIFRERLGGSLKKNFFGLDETKKSGSEKRIKKNAKPGIAFSVATSKDLREVPPMQVPQYYRPAVDPTTVGVMVLGGEPGRGLFPLTRNDATPAIPIGGKYRLIDIPMSNCINSGIKKIFVLTQFNSASLNKHICQTYVGNNVISLPEGFVELLAANQMPGEGGTEWSQGTADAVRKFAWILESRRHRNIENVVILSADQLYKMDYMHFVQRHFDRNAEITISCVAVDGSHPSDYGLVKINSLGKITKFVEKPKGADLQSMKTDTTLVGLSKEEAKKCPYIASMGVYVFKKNVLLNLLRERYPTLHDFGSDIFPVAVEDYGVQAYIFRDYWEDIGSVKIFYEANLALGLKDRKFDFYDPKAPFYTTPSFFPPTKIDKCRIVDSLISHRCRLMDCSVHRSVVGLCSRIGNGVQLEDTIMMGADCYQDESVIPTLIDEGKVPQGVGDNSKIRKCIIEKNAKIGKNVVIANKDGVEEANRPKEGFYIRSGITIVLANETIKDGTIL